MGPVIAWAIINSRILKTLFLNKFHVFNLSHTKATSNNDELIPTYELKVNEDVLENLSVEGKKIFLLDESSSIPSSRGALS